ncbi:hypothetical protein Daesc_009441 [Daldinia eschscholtzii]|uniref:Uncharacterized protein n=1 Tax=Daldinia eschscholtzii TaxID=292717 RepID=A0AAX6MAB8_9PEZI
MSKRKCDQLEELGSEVSWSHQPQKRLKPDATDEDIEMEDATDGSKGSDSGAYGWELGRVGYSNNIIDMYPEEMTRTLDIPRSWGERFGRPSPSPTHESTDYEYYIMAFSPAGHINCGHGGHDNTVVTEGFKILGKYSDIKAANFRVIQIYYDYLRTRTGCEFPRVEMVKEREIRPPGEQSWWIGDNGVLRLRFSDTNPSNLLLVWVLKHWARI